MKIAILQSNYIPWYGYFKMISHVDIFIFLDNVQYTKNDWRNRNRVLINGTPCWLSIPVGQSINRKIQDVELPKNSWRKKHLNTIHHSYSKYPHFELVEKFIFPFIQDESISKLSTLNQRIIESLSVNVFEFNTEFQQAHDDPVNFSPSKRIANLAADYGATEYISGPKARNYLQNEHFSEVGVKLSYVDYGNLARSPMSNVTEESLLSIVHGISLYGKDALYVIGGRE